jgi:CheY-like chemotaxis protein
MLRPDYILMDIRLPGLRSRVTKWLKENRSSKAIPVVAVTAFAMKGDGRIRRGGCEAYQPKPISVGSSSRPSGTSRFRRGSASILTCGQNPEPSMSHSTRVCVDHSLFFIHNLVLISEAVALRCGRGKAPGPARVGPRGIASSPIRLITLRNAQVRRISWVVEFGRFRGGTAAPHDAAPDQPHRLIANFRACPIRVRKLSRTSESRNTSNFMILVRSLDLKFLKEWAAAMTGTLNPPHEAAKF